MCCEHRGVNGKASAALDELITDLPEAVQPIAGDELFQRQMAALARPCASRHLPRPCAANTAASTARHRLRSMNSLLTSQRRSSQSRETNSSNGRWPLSHVHVPLEEFPILRAEYRRAGPIAAIRRQPAGVRIEFHPARRLPAYHPAFV